MKSSKDDGIQSNISDVCSSEDLGDQLIVKLLIVVHWRQSENVAHIDGRTMKDNPENLAQTGDG